MDHLVPPKARYARLGRPAMAPIIVEIRPDADFARTRPLVADPFHRSVNTVTGSVGA
jgi:hypothetical protein